MFKRLSDFQKFQAGSDLWILFYEPCRDLFKRVNWRTGFLLEGIRSQKKISKSVLIDTHNMFPNEKLVCLSFNQESWVFDVHKHWDQLKKPSLRVFGHLKGHEEELNQDWPQADLLYNLSYYVEKKA